MENLLPTFEPSERDLVMRAMAQPLAHKIRLAVDTIGHYSDRADDLHHDGMQIADSFGKDSCVIVELARMAGIKHHCVHRLTTMDAPELIYFGRNYHPETRVSKPSTPMVQMMFEKGKLPPTRVVAWCCDLYKHNSSKDHAVCVGVRVQESGTRMRLWKQFVPRKGSKGFNIAPILYWTEKDVWEFIRMQKLPYCELYDQGCSRLGCVGCPKNGDARVREFKRWPKYEKRWHDAIVKTWEKWKDVPRLDGEDRSFKRFKTGEDAWTWWITKAHKGGGGMCLSEQMLLNV